MAAHSSRRRPAAPRTRTIVAVAASCVVIATSAWFWHERSGVEVLVHNADPDVARAVEVSTTAGVYVLGDLAPGATARTLVGARGTSSVRVAWTRVDGTRELQDVGPYFQARPDGASLYGGEVRVTLMGDRATAESTVETRLSPLTRGAAPAPDRTGPESYPR